MHGGIYIMRAGNNPNAQHTERHYYRGVVILKRYDDFKASYIVQLPELERLSFVSLEKAKKRLDELL